MLWRFRGTPHYLGQQSSRLGVTPVLADRARNNQEIYRVSVLLAQLCERYHKARKEDGRPILHGTEMGQVRGTLEQAEQECAKLHALAATAAEMIDEAYRGFRDRTTAADVHGPERLRRADDPAAARRRDGRRDRCRGIRMTAARYRRQLRRRLRLRRANRRTYGTLFGGRAKCWPR